MLPVGMSVVIKLPTRFVLRELGSACREGHCILTVTPQLEHDCDENEGNGRDASSE
jgi:hypothetical protein